MPIINRDRYPDEVFFDEADFLEIGTRFDGAKIIQIGSEGDAPLIAFAYTDDPVNEDLNPIELWSVMKFCQGPDEYKFYDKPKSLDPNVRVIHKYVIPEQGEFSLELELSAEILTVQPQSQQLCLWVLLNRRNLKVERDFIWIPTGEEIKHRNIKYITTLQLDGGKKVTHLFEIKVDFSPLENLLAEGKCREADLETFRILKKLCGADDHVNGENIKVDGIGKIAFGDLQTINKLWQKYSNGRFGYTTQLSIAKRVISSWESYDPRSEDWIDVCAKLGWNHTVFPLLKFKSNAPKGHLPAIVAWGIGSPGLFVFRQTYQALWARFER